MTDTKPVGRPPLPAEQRRSVLLSVRVKQAAADALDATGMPRPDAVRTLLTLGLAAWSAGHRDPSTIPTRRRAG